MEIYTCRHWKDGICGRFIPGSGSIASGARNVSIGPSDEVVCEQPTATDTPGLIVCDEKDLQTENIALVDSGDGAGPS